MRLNHKLGQVFLKEARSIRRIVNAIDIKDKVVLEIGPGSGRITRHLLKQAKMVHCVEVDRRLVDFLDKEFTTYANFKLNHCDILKFPLKKVGKRLVIFGNIPYQISKKIINYLIDHRKFISVAYLTCQKEFNQKLVALPSSGQYGALSCYCRYYCDAKVLFNIGARAFSPKPKVDSSLIKMSFDRKPLLDVREEVAFFEFVRKAFSTRRKKLINSLKLKRGRELLEELNINPGVRAQNLSLEDFVKLFKNDSKF
ncbi:MAG: ribosomal RNA small subunit methyltransferase A [Candidatus Omnitrophica bacterium]|nr:ribosomal RNA small subunit methyltransferase A [Candidatus Omnitrophota bacterium]